MKTLKLTLLIIAISFSGTTNAQIFKKLGKKLEKAAERTIERKAEEKTERETEKAFDSTFNNSSNKKEKSGGFNIGQSNAKPDGTYNFTHKYVMEIKDKKNTNTITYYLTNSGNYLGYKMDQKNNNEMFMVMDGSKNAVFTFMDMNNDKTMMAISFNFENTANNEIEEQNITIEKTGRTKTILNYLCEEFKVSGEDTEGSIWVTQNAGVQFLNLTDGIKGKKSFNSAWLNYAKGLVMEMDMTDKSKRKPEKIIMTCIALDKEKFNLNTSNYKSMF